VSRYPVPKTFAAKLFIWLMILSPVLIALALFALLYWLVGGVKGAIISLAVLLVFAATTEWLWHDRRDDDR